MYYIDGEDTKGQHRGLETWLKPESLNSPRGMGLLAVVSAFIKLYGIIQGTSIATHYVLGAYSTPGRRQVAFIAVRTKWPRCTLRSG